MVRHIVAVATLALAPVYASAQSRNASGQQACTADPKEVVEEIYGRILERPTRDDSADWEQALRNGMTVRELVRTVAHSPEHMRLVSRDTRGNSAAQLERTVSALYRHLLGRPPERAGLDGWINKVPREGLPSVIDQMIDSPEYTNNFGDWRVPGSRVRYCGGTNTTAQSASGSRSAYTFRPDFSQADRNRDGRITISEWDDTRAAFRQVDRNNDNVITRDEYDGAAGSGRATGWRSARFDELDRNRNGRIDRNEWRDSADAFTWLDRNDDGSLSRREVVGDDDDRQSR